MEQQEFLEVYLPRGVFTIGRLIIWVIVTIIRAAILFGAIWAIGQILP